MAQDMCWHRIVLITGRTCGRCVRRVPPTFWLWRRWAARTLRLREIRCAEQQLPQRPVVAGREGERGKKDQRLDAQRGAPAIDFLCCRTHQYLWTVRLSEAGLEYGMIPAMFNRRFFTPVADVYANVAALPGVGRTWRLALRRAF